MDHQEFALAGPEAGGIARPVQRACDAVALRKQEVADREDIVRLDEDVDVSGDADRQIAIEPPTEQGTFQWYELETMRCEQISDCAQFAAEREAGMQVFLESRPENPGELMGRGGLLQCAVDHRDDRVRNRKAQRLARIYSHRIGRGSFGIEKAANRGGEERGLAANWILWGIRHARNCENRACLTVYRTGMVKAEPPDILAPECCRLAPRGGSRGWNATRWRGRCRFRARSFSII